MVPKHLYRVQKKREIGTGSTSSKLDKYPESEVQGKHSGIETNDPIAKEKSGEFKFMPAI